VTRLVAILTAVVSSSTIFCGTAGALVRSQTPAFYFGESYRTGCDQPSKSGSDTASKGWANRIDFQNAQGLTVRISGYFKGIAGSAFTATANPTTRIWDPITRFEFSATNVQLPAGTQGPVQLTFTYQRNGSTHHWHIGGALVEYAPCISYR
jgi:hypothetical protein